MLESIKTVENRIFELLSSPQYQPLKQHELAKSLKLRGTERAALRHKLYAMEREGRVVCLRKNRWALPDANRHVKGRLRTHIQGFGFVIPEQPGTPDVFIPEANMGTALDGDTVIVAVTRSSAKAPPKGSYEPTADRNEGRILQVVERLHTTLVGLLRHSPYYWYVIPDNPRIPHNIRVMEFGPRVPDPQERHKVVVRLAPWESTSKPLTGAVEEDLGAADDPGVDVLSVARDHRIDPTFDAGVVHEARQHDGNIPSSALHGREDLRDVLTFTIDPEDAKDFDDAVSLQRTEDGQWLLGVHIADVPFFVAPGSAIDKDAFQRGNSVYMVDRTITMLPPYLTTEVCSLQPRRDRLTHSAFITLDEDGKRLAERTTLSVIRSAARLTYDQVQALFDGRDDHGIPSAVQEALGDMRRLARILRRNRSQAGAIDLTIPEIRCVLDQNGHPLELKKRMSSEAYQLIEELMLSANCVVASTLRRHMVPAIYRIHEPPDEEQWGRMNADLQALGLRESVSSRDDLNRVARAAEGSPLAYSIHLALLRNLKRAVYSSTLNEHFGLAFDCYTHFTSPIRRYPDLVVHRLLCAIEADRPPPYSQEEVSSIAHHCSETERNADEAEDESVTIKRVEYYEGLLHSRKTGPFEGLIVSVTPKGLIVELIDTLQRGLLPFSSLIDDYYVAHPDRTHAVGRRHRKKWTIGQRLNVLLAKVDATRRLVDFHMPAETSGSPGVRERSGKKKKKR
ncbi:MAG TPA: ribonuclease R [Kiritimatiellia bacterium]|nr:ribonuclease R [Kiritimatiellia bacterium]